MSVPMRCRKGRNSERASNTQNAKRPEVPWDEEPSSEPDDITQNLQYQTESRIVLNSLVSSSCATLLRCARYNLGKSPVKKNPLAWPRPLVCQEQVATVFFRKGDANGQLLYYLLLAKICTSDSAWIVTPGRLMDSVQSPIPVNMPTEILATLVELGEEINSSLDLDEVLRKTAAIVKRLVDYEIFSVLLVDDSAQKLYHRFTIGYGEEASKDWQIPIGHGITGTAASTKRTVRVPDVREDPAISTSLIRCARTRCALVVKGNRSACWISRVRKWITSAINKTPG